MNDRLSLNNHPFKSYIAANLGDSRVVLARGLQAIELTNDHKPELPLETERIKRLGGFALSLGMVQLKQMAGLT